MPHRVADPLAFFQARRGNRSGRDPPRRPAPCWPARRSNSVHARTSGMPRSAAIMPPGKLMKPPMPSTTSGRMREKCAQAWLKAAQQIEAAAAACATGPCRAARRNAPRPSRSRAPGTSRASMPSGLPIQTILPAVTLQFVGHRQPGHDVAAGAARHDEDRLGQGGVFRGLDARHAHAGSPRISRRFS